MNIAILVDELPASSAPTTVGEEAFHLNELGDKCDVYVLKYRSDEILPPHMQRIRLIHLDMNLGAFARFCSLRVPTFSFFSLYHLMYPYMSSYLFGERTQRYDVVLAHYSAAAIFASKLNRRTTKSVLYYWDPISYIFGSAYAGGW